MNLSLKSSPKNKTTIENSIKEINAMSKALILSAYKKIGQESLNYAIRNRLWEDYTGNLQDSMGYGIFENGALIFWETLQEKDYDWHYGHKVSDVGDSPNPSSLALQIINNNVDLFSTGYKLLVVAGMGYALNVESIHLHEVLTQAFSFTKENWGSYFYQIAT